MIKRLILLFICFGIIEAAPAQKPSITLYGQASYYAAKFHGRRTASGDIFNHSKLTAACNSLPLNTRVRITNLRNGRSVIAITNDRLHAKTSRLIDLTKTGAERLGFVKAGLTRVKVEILRENEVE
ncbi:septal ring lytic transglycosylase RlpA family protein [Ferruginibacter sp. HRS2-29]|uniref:septal ring lytic transglycosylase RlpA family protein n=1 Tax=Ferruginibacter sp. HRS2-29 TaxID=2487334 RepID=UPI0020CDBCB6|nr:septal ring lytic transglycosylase RlpA family protein [Ferruginibacter sp. HRS2-29]MCP9752253.1 septal ring lytic transglycosylase RlpA family protein [Ferruginibacter sp. HRS2-29]